VRGNDPPAPPFPLNNADASNRTPSFVCVRVKETEKLALKNRSLHTKERRRSSAGRPAKRSKGEGAKDDEKKGTRESTLATPSPRLAAPSRPRPEAPPRDHHERRRAHGKERDRGAGEGNEKAPRRPPTPRRAPPPFRSPPLAARPKRRNALRRTLCTNSERLALDLFLDAQLVRAAARLLAAVLGARVHARVALAADHLVLVVLARKDLQRRLDDATAQAQDQVQRRLLLDVVVGQRAAVLELLAGEDQALLVRGDPLLVLDLRLDVLDRVGGLDLLLRVVFGG
jgi:hypothetical protein